MEIVLQGVQPAKYEAGQVVSGFLQIPATNQLMAEDVTIALIGVTEVKWIPENAYGVHGIGPPLALHDTKRCLELEQHVTDQSNLLFFSI